VRILKGQPIRRQVVATTAALLVPFVFAAIWTANLTRIEHVEHMAAVGDLHRRCVCVAIGGDDLHAEALQLDRDFLAQLPGSQ